jgi:multiple sugar transport system ATP-binding protein
VVGTVFKRPTGLGFEMSSATGADQFVLPLDPALFRDPEKLMGKQVILGIRPEHLSNGNAPGLASIEATVQMVETTGADAFVRLGQGQAQFVMRAPGHDRPAINQKRRLNFDLSAAHFFDAATGEAIR